jgi:AcrR family transcriptional regulator
MVRPRAAERVDLRAAAIEAAARLCAERGADALTMRDVAAAAGCSAPALYRYFPGKEALLLAVHDEGFRRLYAAKAAAVSGGAAVAAGDPLARLRAGGLAYVRFALENPDLYDLMFNDRGPQRWLEAAAAAANGGAGAAAVQDLARRSLEILRESVLGCQRAGYLAGLDADAAAFALWSVVHGAASLALRRRPPFDSPEMRRAAEAAVETMTALVAATGRGGAGGATPCAPSPRRPAASR